MRERRMRCTFLGDHSFLSPTSNRRNNRHFARTTEFTLNNTVVISLEAP